MYGRGLNMNGVPHVDNYGDAKRVWEKSIPRRGTDGSERPICHNRRRYRHTSIVKCGDSYAFRWSQTDVITYYPDGTLMIEPRISGASGNSIQPFLPIDFDLRTMMTQGVIAVRKRDAAGWVGKDDRYYRADNTLHFKPSDGEFRWEAINPYPWETKITDRRKMREVCKAWGYPLFRDCAPVAFGLQGRRGCEFAWPGRLRALEALKDGPMAWSVFIYTNIHPAWRRRVRVKFFDGDPPYTLRTVMRYLREAIRHTEKAYTIEKLPYLTGYSAWLRMMRRQKW